MFKVMFLLDVLPIDPTERARRIREIKPIIADTIGKVRETVTDTIDATKDAGGASNEASLLWPIAIVALALAGCVYLAHLYRRRRMTA